MNSAPKPKGIVVDVPQRLLQINWSDGESSIFDFDTLRRACPCAECRPWIHELVKTAAPHEPSDAVKNARGDLNSVQDIQPVGSYALQFNWADGHVFGIYDWKYLRDLDHSILRETPKESN